MFYGRLWPCFFIVAHLLSPAMAGTDDDWPTFRHDMARSGATEAKLELPLALHWQTTAAASPQPAWPAAAYGDIWRRSDYLHPSETTDRAPHVVTEADRCS